MLLSIEKLVYGGDGLARTESGQDGRSTAVFVPFVLPGETVEAEIRQQKPGLARGQVSRLVSASAERVEPDCPYFQRCGGCHYQHIPYARQLEFKAQILRETLQRIAKIELCDEIHLHPSPPWNYRNRTRFQVRATPEFSVGFFRFGSHEFLPVRECPISSPLINRAIAQLIECSGLDCPPVVEEIELFADGEDAKMLAAAFCAVGAQKKDLERWANLLLSEIPDMAGVVCLSSRKRFDEDALTDPKLITRAGATSLPYRSRYGTYQVSAGAFFQVNRHLLEELVSVVTGDASGELALDLYAGGGLFTVPLAEKFHHTFAVESSQTSVTDLRKNVPASVKVINSRTEEYLRNRQARHCPDLVVLDPPRAGAGKAVTRSLVELGAKRVRYVSCDPATLARDLSTFLSSGYRIVATDLFDLFPQTFHIETVVQLAR
ncbi:MAG TPA: 23S rRNA (uracil(1939)-C(5))-methyltransferase RlmD [Terriglobales bacterium]|nr:23S rRNA (uracil(1939)-C(5))-methyltransferase RlmD [Terriglobales bacterium]